ncbi:MAG: anthranilate phosphoribosyltransferase [Rhodothermales bacterium]|nr:anthranilate phosphoribosyltransferase [Rhodothermales bacterium]
MTEYLKIIASGDTLTDEQASGAMHLLLKGESTPEQTAGLLMGLRGRGESIDELTAFTRVMREYAVPVHIEDGKAIDVVGTGGDGSGTFNISTTTMLVCAGAGATVAKHGNRSVSSKCGSADVLRELGVFVELPAAAVEKCIADAGLGFMFAPLFHPALRFVMPVRRALAVRTFFNILGPLCNPAGVQRGVFGAFSEDVADTMGTILSRLGGERVYSVHSEDGLDEYSIAAPTRYTYHASGAAPVKGVSAPEDLGLKTAPLSSLKGGDAEVNAGIIRRILDGDHGPHRDVVLLNAAYALVTADIAENPADGVSRAAASIDSGAALKSLQALAQASHDHRPTGD